MKKIGLVVLLTAVTSSVYGQQFLWSTVKTDSGRYVPLTSVTKEVLTFYDQYRYYHDLSGYSKSRFIEEMHYGFDDWGWLKNIKDLTVFAMKSNTGDGSVIIVMCVSKQNVNALIFSNKPESMGAQGTYSTNRTKFADWFKTILN